MTEQPRQPPEKPPLHLYNGRAEDPPATAGQPHPHLLWAFALCAAVGVTSFCWWGAMRAASGAPAPWGRLPVNVPLLRLSDPVAVTGGYVQIVKIATWEDWEPLSVRSPEPLPRQFILRAKNGREMPVIELLPAGGPGPKKD